MSLSCGNRAISVAIITLWSTMENFQRVSSHNVISRCRLPILLLFNKLCLGMAHKPQIIYCTGCLLSGHPSKNWTVSSLLSILFLSCHLTIANFFFFFFFFFFLSFWKFYLSLSFLVVLECSDYRSILNHSTHSKYFYRVSSFALLTKVRRNFLFFLSKFNPIPPLFIFHCKNIIFLMAKNIFMFFKKNTTVFFITLKCSQRNSYRHRK